MKEQLEQWIKELNDWKDEKPEKRAFILLTTDIDERNGTYAADGDAKAIAAGILSSCVNLEKMDEMFIFLRASKALEFVLTNMDDFKRYVENREKP